MSLRLVLRAQTRVDLERRDQLVIAEHVAEGDREAAAERRAEAADADANNRLRHAFDVELGAVGFDLRLRRGRLGQAERMRREQLRDIARTCDRAAAEPPRSPSPGPAVRRELRPP